MSIDIPHGGGSDTPASQDIGPSIKKPSLPYGVSQKHWDEAGRIIREASDEVAQTLRSDKEPIGNFDSRLSKIFQDSQLRTNEIFLSLDSELISILLLQFKYLDTDRSEALKVFFEKGLSYQSSFSDTNYKCVEILSKILNILGKMIHSFETTGSKIYLLTFIKDFQSFSKIPGIELDFSKICIDKAILLKKITSVLRGLVQEYEKNHSPETKQQYETIYDFAVKHKLLVQINNNLPRSFVFHREINKNNIQNYRGGLIIRA